MNVLITGISGFVGEYLAKLIHDKSPKYHIFGIDRSVKLFELFPVLNKSVKIYQCDITNSKQVEDAIKKIKPDQIYHLAGFASTKSEDKDLVYKINVQGSLNILEALKKNNKKSRILLASSSHVYGETKKTATEKSAVKPLNVYGKSKLEMENEALKYKNKLEIIIARPSNHIGPKQGRGFLVPDKISEIISGKVNIINPKTKKDFSDVRDVVNAYRILMQKGKSGEIYNISNEKEKTVEAIVKIIIKSSGKKVEVGYSQTANNLSRNSTSSKKIRKLGWKPKYKIEETLKNTWNYWMRKGFK